MSDYTGDPEPDRRDLPYHMIYTDSLTVAGREHFAGDKKIKVTYRYDAGGVNATREFYLTDEKARDLVNQLEEQIEDESHESK